MLMSCNKGAQDFPPSCMVLFCSVLGSGFWAAGSGVQGVVSTVRGRRSDELDFLLRRVEQAFHLKIKLENEVIVKREFQVRDLLLTR